MTAKVTLRTNQKRAIKALMTSITVQSAAEVAGVSRQTIYRWLHEPTFRAALAEAEAATLAELSRNLVKLGDKAALALEAGLDDVKVSTRLRAADVHLRHVMRLQELLNLETRLSDLERQVGGTK